VRLGLPTREGETTSRIADKAGRLAVVTKRRMTGWMGHPGHRPERP